jgi:hypothetical protein
MVSFLIVLRPSPQSNKAAHLHDEELLHHMNMLSKLHAFVQLSKLACSLHRSQYIHVTNCLSSKVSIPEESSLSLTDENALQQKYAVNTYKVIH